MTGFILNGLSESLLSSRLFRIKAWVLQVPFLSMIFLYFFDHSNLNHSKVFYLFLSLLYPYYVLLLCRLLPVQNFYLYFFTLLVPFSSACSFFTPKGNNPHIYLVSFFCSSPSQLVSFLPQNSFKKDTTLCFFLHSPVRIFIYVLAHQF